MEYPPPPMPPARQAPTEPLPPPPPPPQTKQKHPPPPQNPRKPPNKGAPSRPSSRSQEHNSQRHKGKGEKPREPERRTVENFLNRDTPFVAHVKFRNTLPQLPCDPKLLTRQLDTDELSKFRLTQSERDLRPELAISLGPETLSAVNIKQFCREGNPGEVHPDDRALIEGHVGNRQQSSNVSWLMKTRYLQNRTSIGAATKTGPKTGKVTLTLQEAKEQIEASFKAAKEAPVHPSRPDLTPVEVMPLLPFDSRYGSTYVTVSSSSDVVTHVLAENTSEKEREELYERSLMREYRSPSVQPSRKCMALLLPSTGGPEDENGVEADGSGRYLWAREFAMETQDYGDNSKSYILTLGKKSARYIPVNSNIILSKRKRDELAVEVPPEHVDVEHRQLLPEEQEWHQQRIAALYGFDGADG